jgi:hypothetical protein
MDVRRLGSLDYFRGAYRRHPPSFLAAMQNSATGKIPLNTDSATGTRSPLALLQRDASEAVKLQLVKPLRASWDDLGGRSSMGLLDAGWPKQGSFQTPLRDASGAHVAGPHGSIGLPGKE